MKTHWVEQLGKLAIQCFFDSRQEISWSIFKSKDAKPYHALHQQVQRLHDRLSERTY